MHGEALTLLEDVLDEAVARADRAPGYARVASVARDPVRAQASVAG